MRQRDFEPIVSAIWFFLASVGSFCYRGGCDLDNAEKSADEVAKRIDRKLDNAGVKLPGDH